MSTSHPTVSQLCTVSSLSTCRRSPVWQQKPLAGSRHTGLAHKEHAPKDLAFGRRLCTAGLLAGVCAFAVGGGKVPFWVNSQLGSSAVNAERVYNLESKLHKSGFTEKQARALILAAACLRRLGKKVSFDDVSKVFDTAWSRMTCLKLALTPCRPVSWA